MLGAADSPDVLDNYVLIPDFDLSVATLAFVKLLGNRSDDPDFITFVSVTGEAGSSIWQS